MNSLTLFLITIFWLFLFYLLKTLKKPKNYPPGPNWWPFIGNTYQLRKFARSIGGQHIALEEWSKKFNSQIIGLKLGSELVTVVFGYENVKEVHTRDEFTGRPDNFFLRLRTMGTRLGITCTDGSLWSEHRMFTTRHLKQAGYGRSLMEAQIRNELIELLTVIENLKESPVWPGSFLAPSVINVLWAFTAGKRIPRNDKKLNTLLTLLQKRLKIFDMCGGILTQLPWLRFVLPEWTGYNLICKFNTELHEFFMDTIREHKINFTEEKLSDDLIYAYIKEMQERQGLTDNNTFTDKQLTMTILDIFLAGSYTTSTTLDLALMMMTLRPDIQKRVYDEICNNISIKKNEEFIPSISDKSNIPYVEALLMEVQRYFHIVPLSGPRRTLKETTLGEYTLPKNTTILIGLQSVLMEEEHWKDPENFRPERFLSEDGKVVSSEYFIPFGQGKRRCLGDSLARACLFTFFVGILKKFELVLAEGEQKPSVKLQPGITLSPRPYKVQFKLRPCSPI